MKEIRDFIEELEKSLATAAQALDTGDYDSCVVVCYYAMFFMAQAVFLAMNLSASCNKGVISPFGGQFEKTEICDRETMKAVEYARRVVKIKDSDIGFVLTKEVARDLLEIAQNFAEKLGNYFKMWMEFEGKK